MTMPARENPSSASPAIADSPPRREGFSAGAFLATAAVVGYGAYLLRVVIPRYEQVFKDFGTRLPASTQLILDISRWFGGWPMYAACLLPIAAGLLLPRVVPARLEPADPVKLARRLRHVLLAAWTLVLVLLMYMATTSALTEPMMQLIQNISSSPSPTHP